MPVRGEEWLLAAGCVAFVLACQALAVLLIVLTANLGSALGAASVLFGPAAAFSGVSFPLSGMAAAARGAGRAPAQRPLVDTDARGGGGRPPRLYGALATRGSAI